MKSLVLAGVLAGCAVPPVQVAPENEDPRDTVWASSLHAGDLVVLVPGTGSHDYLAAELDAIADPVPVVNVRERQNIAEYATVFEQAIAIAQRAEVPLEELDFAVWGVGFARTGSFVYVSYDGHELPITILGGQSACATGSIFANLGRYTGANAKLDATDLHAKVTAYLAAHPAPDRHVVLASHSWGGAVAEYLTFERPDLEGGVLSLTVAMGVPGFVPGYTFAGPGLRDFAAGHYLYEIDRPDDPVHNLDANGDGNGHEYDILIGDEFLGSYGITTDELSCAGVAGACPHPG